jgi:methylated-DNA-[protein]-cysteine S-methyltransferase
MHHAETSHRTFRTMHCDRLATPIGAILFVFDDDGVLRALEFEEHAARMHRSLRLQYALTGVAFRAAPRELKAALRRYFEGDPGATAKIAWTTGGTAFQRSVWNALTQLAPGTTTTYGALARSLGNAAATRAVGLANGANPICIVVPCHRVIGADGSLTGYGGGLHRKRWLLEHEGVATEARRRPERNSSADGEKVTAKAGGTDSLLSS